MFLFELFIAKCLLSWFFFIFSLCPEEMWIVSGPQNLYVGDEGIVVVMNFEDDGGS